MSDTDPVVLINVYRCDPSKLEALMDFLTVMFRAQLES